MAITAGIALLGLAGLKASNSISSSIMEAGAIKAEASFRASQYERNAALALFKSSDAIRRGEKEAFNKAIEVKKMLGRQKAVAAASGGDISSGSNIDLQMETAGLGALDIVTIRNNAWKEAWGYRVEAANATADASFTRVSGKYNARRTVLTGGLQAAEDIMGGYAQYKGATK